MSPSSSDASASSGSVEVTTSATSSTGDESSVADAASAASKASGFEVEISCSSVIDSLPYPNTQKTILVSTRSSNETTAMMKVTKTKTTEV
ncbi:unannotated protein [freshwater metagenome]|uniref:Unannotated protein n=1 Tax=freshwater metagenome TaxID=449393 RepID=A0A6J6ULM1_9ZZZZ